MTKLKVEEIDGRVITSGKSRYYLPLPHPVPQAGQEVDDTLLKKLEPKKTPNLDKAINVGIGG